MIPIALYVHVPWCVRKCPYCDFDSHEHRAMESGVVEGDLELEYLRQIVDDLSCELDNLAQVRGLEQREFFRPELQSIFIGGGTPSLMSPDFYRRLLDTVNERFSPVANMEVTLEANPGTAEAAKFEGYFDAGVNRLSIGVQSFADSQLKSLGRIHSGNEAKAAFSIAREAGFENINIDLMHGLPGQNREDALADIESALALNPEHISWYQLTIERNTVFYNKPPVLPAELELESIQEAGHKLLDQSGYCRYEVSAYARSGRISSHNMNYWLFGDYLGIGAGAHGKISNNQRVTRRAKTRTPKDYIAAQEKLASEVLVESSELPLEFLMNALRLVDGFEAQMFNQRTGLALSVIEPGVEKLRLDGLLEEDNERIRCTPQGLRYLDSVLAGF